MLLNKKTLDGIKAGEIDLVFRRWKKPTVKTGGHLRTRSGELSIKKVERYNIGKITKKDATRAGFA